MCSMELYVECGKFGVGQTFKDNRGAAAVLSWLVRVSGLPVPYCYVTSNNIRRFTK